MEPIIALEKARSSVKCLFSNRAARLMIVSKAITSIIAKMGAVLLLIRSVKDSAFPIPPQEPHISPN
ncbi:hypothetical protein A1L58_17910 [Shewanella baltica]|nr:hypothetical protein A1L58_17910 [Shewanella baltica]